MLTKKKPLQTPRQLAVKRKLKGPLAQVLFYQAVWKVEGVACWKSSTDDD